MRSIESTSFLPSTPLEDPDTVARHKAEKKARMQADLAKLQGMVTAAKQSNAMCRIRELWNAAMGNLCINLVAKWHENVSDQTIDVEYNCAIPHDDSELSEDDYDENNEGGLQRKVDVNVIEAEAEETHSPRTSQPTPSRRQPKLGLDIE